jgi:6-phosphofructokinase 1
MHPIPLTSKTLFVVSGGDAPGINTVLAHFTQLAADSGETVCGAIGGFAGLLKGNLVTLSAEQLAPLVGLPGSYLPSSREPVLRSDEGKAHLLSSLREHQISSLILLGGNGSLRILLPILRDLGIPCIGLPNTIDNDVPGTELTLGFDSACNFAYPIADGILATARALPGRIFTLETLGGESGMLALEIAVGVGADAVLLREFDYEETWLGQRTLQAIQRHGYAMLVHGEGARGSRTLANTLQRLTAIRVRDTRLGHAQRGAAPTHRDRTLAVQMVRIARHALRDGSTIGTVVVNNGRPQFRPGTLEGLPPRVPDQAVYLAINELDG